MNESSERHMHFTTGKIMDFDLAPKEALPRFGTKIVRIKSLLSACRTAKRSASLQGEGKVYQAVGREQET